jgi:hypothetical protein
MPFPRLFSLPRQRLTVALLSCLVGVPALSAHAQSAGSSGGFFAPGRPGTIFTVGWQVGQYAQHGMGNMYYHALRLNRGENQAGVEKPMTWSQGYGGPCFGLTVVDDDLTIDIRWNNRHTIHSARWTDLAGDTWNTSYRVRLNELSIGVGYPLWGGRLRPGASADLGIFRVSRRDGKGDDKGKWASMHARGKGLLEPGERSPTAGFTLYCDAAPLGKLGGGLTVRPFYQWHLMEPDLFGLAGTFDTRSFQYGIQNYGLAVSWGFASK